MRTADSGACPWPAGFTPPIRAFFRYTAGLYRGESGSIAVSRGLGNRLFPLRLFNRPELLAVTLVQG